MSEPADTMELLIRSPEESHRAAVMAHALCKRLVADGKVARLVATECADARSLQQNAFYWGVVLRDIADQARPAGQRYTAEAWHELAKRQFLGYRFKRVLIAGRKRKTVIKELRSTSDLSVKRMTEYLEKVIAFAVTELGVQFVETRWENHR